VLSGPALREGARGPRVAALRRRLAATGDLPPGLDRDSELFDRPVADAVRRFQSRHGIEADAVVGKRTLAELNTPAARRAAQVVANLERLRWLPRQLGPRHLLVNVADYRLVLTEGGVEVDTMRVIVGRQARRTPFFAGEIASIRLNPSWTVPEKLAIEDKLPLLRRDPDLLRDQGFRVFAYRPEGLREIDPGDVDWSRVSDKHFPYLLRQDPGPQNALGRIKFQIPNRYDIYLHDTPSRGLFARAERGFSSGCIRVERALDIAERLLAGHPAWPRARIVAAIEAAETVDIALPEPMPVYLLAWTAWVDDDGALQFRDDIYGSDAAILEALARPPAPP
jgi:murein L,D-transpeptidase YcbB/YkuD